MIISHKSKYIFVHIPKTAGTSIEAEFNICEACVLSGEVFNFFDKPSIAVYKHADLNFIKWLWGNEIYNSYYRFSIVRNPFDRIISMYWFFRAMCGYCSEPWLVKLMMLNGKDILDLNSWIIRLLTEKFLKLKDEALRSQIEYIYVDDRIDCEIFKFEDGLNNAVTTISKNIQKKDKEFPIISVLSQQVNTKARQCRRNYREVINCEARDVIEVFYKRDFELLGYEW